MHVHHWQDVELALQDVTTAVLHTSPRLTAVKQMFTFFVSQGSKHPSL
jgi:hypothetical protein